MSVSSSSTVAIVPGFAEGGWHSQHLRTALTANGYKVVDDESEADIIITHSAGCYLLPKLHRAQTVLIVGPPYWPRKPLLISMGQKIFRDAHARFRDRRFGYWLQKSLWNLFYMLGGGRVVLATVFATHRHKWPHILKASRVIIVRNHADSWSPPRLRELLEAQGRFSFMELAGEHDDLWVNPEPYINLIQSKS